MMNRVTGSTFLLAGTAIGAGMIALPITLAKIGLWAGLLVLLGIWLTVFYSARVTNELNRRMGKATPINGIALTFGGPFLQWICQLGILLLTYALMVAYIYGGSSLLHVITWHWLGEDGPVKSTLILGFTAFLFLIFISKTTWIDSVNRILFMALLMTLTIVIAGLGIHLTPSALPLKFSPSSELSHWTLLLPVVFTSFGFQLTIPTVVEYLNLSQPQIKRSLFWGSLIPAIVYILWSIATLGIIHQEESFSYETIRSQNLDVGPFIDLLSQASQWPTLKGFSWAIGILALVTSAIGVGLGIRNFWEHKYQEIFPHSTTNLASRFTIGVLVIGFPFMISLFLKDAFIQALAFGGMLLVILSLLIPLYLLWKSDHVRGQNADPLTQNNFLRGAFFCVGSLIFLCEIFNILRKGILS